jgi:xylulokinase
MARLFLGLDSSTQSLSAVLVDLEARRVVLEASLGFDEALPAYGTRHGVLRSDDPRVVHAPPLMWAEALDRLLEGLRRRGAPLGEVLAIAGSGQQHGSVYLSADAEPALERLDPARPLAVQLAAVFSRSTAPVWMDSSTTEECREIEAALGGPGATAEATGSAAFERFTGPQIRRFAKTEPGDYGRTARVALVSSFMASLLAGRLAPIDHGDGAGTNLMDIRARRWHPGALEATAPGLGDKLPPLAPPWEVVGPVARYWVERHGVSPAALACAWSGDNPCSLVGTGLVREGRVAVSLGTSDTIFGAMDAPRVDASGTGHVFGAPTGGFMGLTCFANGSLARDRVRREHGLDWDGFAAALARVPAGGGGILLPWFVPEISPLVRQAGARAYGADTADAARHVRALVDGQFLAMARHASWMGVAIDTIHATGGGTRCALPTRGGRWWRRCR